MATTTKKPSTAYILMKAWIKKGTRSKEEMLEKVEKYHDLKGITEEEYEELLELVDAMPE